MKECLILLKGSQGMLHDEREILLVEDKVWCRREREECAMCVSLTREGQECLEQSDWLHSQASSAGLGRSGYASFASAVAAQARSKRNASKTSPTWNPSL